MTINPLQQNKPERMKPSSMKISWLNTRYRPGSQQPLTTGSTPDTLSVSAKSYNWIKEIKRRRRKQLRERKNNYVKFARIKGFTQAKNQQQSSLRDLMRQGINVNSARFAGRDKDWELARAAAQAGAGSNAAATLDLPTYDFRE